MAREIEEGRTDGEGSGRNGTSTPEGREAERSVMMSTDGGQGPFDRVFAALSNQRRRYVLYYLEQADEGTLTEITRHVVAWETDTPPPEVDEGSERFQETLLTLYHNHLPRLDDFRLAEYDRRSGGVRFRDCLERLLEIIHRSRQQEFPELPFDTE